MATRRQFLTQVTAGAGMLMVPAGLLAAKRARVVVVRAPGLALSGPKVADRERLRRMLQRGLRALAGTDDVRAALSRWVRPVDKVGLKVNCLAGRHMSTHVELTEELIALLDKTGVRRDSAIVFDRGDKDLRQAGYPIRLSGRDYRCLGNDRGGYERDLTLMPSGASRFSKIATQVVSVMINLPILKDHGLAGVTAALKNHFGLIHNPNKFHLNGCDPHIVEVNKARDLVRRKQRLIICDALRVQTEGGPAYHPAGAVKARALLFATDPVALDVIAWELLERLRKGKGLPTLKADRRAPVHVATAARAGLGVGDRRRIDVVELSV